MWYPFPACILIDAIQTRSNSFSSREQVATTRLVAKALANKVWGFSSIWESVAQFYRHNTEGPEWPGPLRNLLCDARLGVLQAALYYSSQNPKFSAAMEKSWEISHLWASWTTGPLQFTQWDIHLTFSIWEISKFEMAFGPSGFMVISKKIKGRYFFPPKCRRLGKRKCFFIFYVWKYSVTKCKHTTSNS